MIPKFRAWNTFHNKWVEHFYITENGLIYNMEQPHRDLIGAVPMKNLVWLSCNPQGCLLHLLKTSYLKMT